MRQKPVHLPSGLLILLASLGCFTPTLIDTASNEEQKEIRFFVADSSNATRLEGVKAILISSEERVAGRTDALGVVSLKASTLKESGAHALLFCSEGFFCGAIRVDAELFEYSERYIELAPFAVR